MNLAISLKAQERTDEAIEVLDTVDWSALTDKFQIANAVLRDEYQHAAELMRKIGPDGELAINNYREWPLFRWFRQQSEFKEAYKDVFGKPYTVDRPKIGEESDSESSSIEDHSEETQEKSTDEM